MAYKKMADYPPKFFEAWQLARVSKLHISFDEKGKATNMRHQLNRFRSFMRKESLELAAPFEAISLTVVQEGDQWALIAQEPDWMRQVGEAMAALGMYKAGADGTENSHEPDTVYSHFSRSGKAEGTGGEG